MKVAITGGTGFVGKHITDELVKLGHKVFLLTRSPEKYSNTESIHYVGWLKNHFQPEKVLPDLDAIINLAGDSLFGYWTKAKKQRILTSRIKATENVLQLISTMNKKPEVLINASAVGYYGTSSTEIFTENTTEPGNDFLAGVTNRWEQEAKLAEDLGVRTVMARLGVILGNGGALPLMSLPFKLFLGGKIGSGEQWTSWIHIKDVVGLIVYALNNRAISGPLNVTAPAPVQNKEFSRVLAKTLHRPYWLPAPSFALRTVLGEMSILVVEGQSVLPEKAQAQNYTYHYPQLEKALCDIY